MITTLTINPFYARRHSYQPIYVKLPRAPINTSPVPGLTSLYHETRRGEFGNSKYPGNCGGRIIEDLLRYFGATRVYDPMTGSGTCRDVCQSLNIECVSSDIRFGVDASDQTRKHEEASFDFIWIHPPYWRQKIYTTDPRDLSQAPTLEAFLERYAQVIRNAASLLQTNGKLAILMGDYMDAKAGFVSLTYHTKAIAFQLGLRQSCTDIIRFSHGASSSRKVYRSSFIPGLHDTCMIFSKA